MKMMTKKDFQVLANVCVAIENDVAPEELVNRLIEFCQGQNPRFDKEKFREWIRRVRAGEDLKGLR